MAGKRGQPADKQGEVILIFCQDDLVSSLIFLKKKSIAGHVL